MGLNVNIGILKINFNKVSAIVVVLAIVLAVSPLLLRRVEAATLTSMSDTLSHIDASTASNHEIKFVTPSGVDAGETIILTFSADFTGVTNIVHTDVDFAEGDSNNCSTASFTEKTLAASPSGATWGADGDSATTVTITSGTGTITADRCVRIKIGTNATSGTTGTNQISNGSADDDDTVAVSGTFGDTGTMAIDIITNDQVVITATVNPTITFTVDDNAIGFGTLTSTTGRWATADASGADASATTPTAANSFTIATNAASGYSITYNGATLTSGANTIDALDGSPAAVDEDSDGTPGQEEFGLSVSTNGNATIATGYQRDSVADFKFIESTATTIVSETVPTATETLSISYLANIAGSTEPGSYTTTITYIATGNF